MTNAAEFCESAGCNHPRSQHVHDHVMHAGTWHDVSRCLDCERDGGPCTDTHAIVDAEDEDLEVLEATDGA